MLIDVLVFGSLIVFCIFCIIVIFRKYGGRWLWRFFKSIWWIIKKLSFLGHAFSWLVSYRLPAIVGFGLIGLLILSFILILRQNRIISKLTPARISKSNSITTNVKNKPPEDMSIEELWELLDRETNRSQREQMPVFKATAPADVFYAEPDETLEERRILLDQSLPPKSIKISFVLDMLVGESRYVSKDVWEVLKCDFAKVASID